MSDNRAITNFAEGCETSLFSNANLHIKNETKEKESDTNMSVLASMPAYETTAFLRWVAKAAESYFDDPDVKRRFEEWRKERKENREKNVSHDSKIQRRQIHNSCSTNNGSGPCGIE